MHNQVALHNNLPQTFHLIGWPGAGRTRVKAQLEEAFAAHKIQAEVIEQPGLVWPEIAKNYPAPTEFLLTVIDSRSKIADEKELELLLNSGDALILSFWQAADLSTQAWWKNQVAKIAANKTCILFGLSPLNAGDIDKLLRLTKSTKKTYWQPLETLEYELSTVVLDHLLMVLDAAQQNLGIQIWRATGVLDTLEYSNLIALEMTRNRLDTFGLEMENSTKQPAQPGLVRLQGYNLNAAEIEGLLQASLAAGAGLVARQAGNNQVNY